MCVHDVRFLVPSDVRNLSISDNTTNLIISWEEPSEPNGNISYIRTLVCTDLFNGSVFLNETIVVLFVSEVVLSQRPFIMCTVTVTPQTGAGRGNSSTESIQTPEAGN